MLVDECTWLMNRITIIYPEAKEPRSSLSIQADFVYAFGGESYCRTKVLPAKVPVILENLPLDGNDPEYLVGMSVAASTAAGINPAAIIPPRRRCMCPSPVAAITRLSATSMGRQEVSVPSSRNDTKGRLCAHAVHVLELTTLLSWPVCSIKGGAQRRSCSP